MIWMGDKVTSSRSGDRGVGGEARWPLGDDHFILGLRWGVGTVPCFVCQLARRTDVAVAAGWLLADALVPCHTDA